MTLRKMPLKVNVLGFIFGKVAVIHLQSLLRNKYLEINNYFENALDPQINSWNDQLDFTRFYYFRRDNNNKKEREDYQKLWQRK